MDIFNLSKQPEACCKGHTIACSNITSEKRTKLGNFNEILAIPAHKDSYFLCDWRRQPPTTQPTDPLTHSLLQGRSGESSRQYTCQGVNRALKPKFPGDDAMQTAAIAADPGSLLQASRKILSVWPGRSMEEIVQNCNITLNESRWCTRYHLTVQWNAAVFISIPECTWGGDKSTCIHRCSHLFYVCMVRSAVMECKACYSLFSTAITRSD